MPYRTCRDPECGAVYATPEDLVAAYNAAVMELNRHGWDPPAAYLGTADAVTITYCQACLSDFDVAEPVAN